MMTDYSKLSNDEIDILVAEAMGWIKSNLVSRTIVDDDGCLGSSGCSYCNRGYNEHHHPDCDWLEQHRIWVHPDVEKWEDTGDPKCYRHVVSYKPSSRDSFETVKREIERRWNCWSMMWVRNCEIGPFEFCIHIDDMPIVIVDGESEQRAGCEAFLQAVEASKKGETEQ